MGSQQPPRLPCSLHSTTDKEMEKSESQPLVGPELPFTAEELGACIKVVSCLKSHQELFLAPWLRPLRKALAPLADMMGGRARDETIGQKRKRELEKIRNGILDKARKLDEQAISTCRLRAERVNRLRTLREDQDIPAWVPLAADGPVRDDQTDHCALTKYDDTSVVERSADPTPRVLFHPRKCYVCEMRFTQLHHFYDWLCPECGEFNYTKRQQTTDLNGRVALVTGARVKIGFFTTLKLLRAGATVIATTRFPCDATERFQREPQYEQFKQRLHIFGIDLRDLVHLHCFLDFLDSTFERLDIIIHNAAQTIRRPPQFYRHLVSKELLCDHQKIMRQGAQSPLSHYAEFQSCTTSSIGVHSQRCGIIDSYRAYRAECERVYVSSALKSQLPLLSSDFKEDDNSFPDGLFDIHGQQLDLRTKNSWILRLGEIETPEVAEVFTINAMAPFIINNRLLSKLERTNRDEPKFIVNVSAMEGKFNRPKRPTHPHTNMAKAALNMMTRTCAADLRRRRIFMNSVDTGWINDENPLELAAKAAQQHGFQPPLDEIDAAARVLDPIFSAIRTPNAEPEFGCFLKDYKPTEW